MSLLSGIEFLSVLLVVGALFLLSLRLRARTSNVVFLAIVTVLILGLIYLSKVTMALLGAILFLIALVALLLVLLFRSGEEKKSTVSGVLLIGVRFEMLAAGPVLKSNRCGESSFQF